MLIVDYPLSFSLAASDLSIYLSLRHTQIGYVSVPSVDSSTQEFWRHSARYISYMWSCMVSGQQVSNVVNERIFVRSMYRFLREPAYLSMNISYTRRLTLRHLHYLFQIYTNTMEGDVATSCMT